MDMKPIQEKIMNEAAYRNSVHNLNEENIKLKRKLQEKQKEIDGLKDEMEKHKNLRTVIGTYYPHIVDGINEKLNQLNELNK